MQRCGVIPYNFNNQELLNFIIEKIKHEFQLDIQIIDHTFNNKILYNRERNQYFSTGILEEVLTYYANDYEKLIVLTEYDLYVPVLTFLFGEAQLNGKAACISIHRLYQEFYGLPDNDNLLFERTIKEVFHELGHTYNLRHCKLWDCVMHSSSNVDEIDIKTAQFCRECKNIIKNNISNP